MVETDRKPEIYRYKFHRIKSAQQSLLDMCSSGVLLRGERILEVRYLPLQLRSFFSASAEHPGRAELEMLDRQKGRLMGIYGNTSLAEAFIEEVQRLSDTITGDWASDGAWYAWRPYVAEAFAAYGMAWQRLGGERIDAETGDPRIGEMLEKDLCWKRMPGASGEPGFYTLDLKKEISLPPYLSEFSR